MVDAVAATGVIGRGPELAVLAAALSDARAGRSRVVVLRGEPGIGKTTLLDALRASATGCTILRASGCEAEHDLTYAVLHRLLGPLLARHVELPDPQRRALGGAFGLVDSQPVDQFLFGLAVLSLLGIAAEERTVVVVVDDAHLVDDGSLGVLSFVARRLDADRALVAIGSRDDRPLAALAGLPELAVGGLAEAAVAELAAAATGAQVDPAVAARLFEATGGSPLAVVEIGQLLSDDQLTGGAELPDPLPIGRRLEAHFDDLVRTLPEPARRLLLVAAAGSAPADHELVTGAAASLRAWPEGLDAVERAGLLRMDPGPRFRHPLVRSVIYAGAPAEERRQAHRALADCADAAGARIRAAWHLGLSTSGPDEAIAARLDAIAGDALDRGGCAMAAAFRLRATLLSPDRATRVERGIAAAETLLLSGSAPRARALLEGLAPYVDDHVQRGQARRLHGQVRYAAGEVAGTVTLLLAAADDLRDLDRHLARDTLLAALSAAQLAGSSPRPGEHPEDVARAARLVPLDPGDEPTIADLFLDASVALHLDGAASARTQVLVALEALDGPGDMLDRRGRPTGQVRWLGLGCWMAGALADDVRLLGLGRRLEATARPHGALAALSVALLQLALGRFARGSLPAGHAHLAERARLQEAMGWPVDIGDLVGRAWAGDVDGARAEADRVAGLAAATDHDWLLVFADYASSVLELGLGRYAAALEPARRTYWENPSLVLVAFPNLVEAAVRADAPELAREAASDLRLRAGDEPTPLVTALLETAAAVCAPSASAASHFEAALACLPMPDGAVHGRIALLYGEWLRRQKRKLDAKAHLRAAHESLAAAGATAFAIRARRELAAAGDRSPLTIERGPGALTAQETQITRLAATGATNAEIAAQLFLSPSTVDYHLRKVFRKLGVTSRRQLGDAAGLRALEDFHA